MPATSACSDRAEPEVKALNPVSASHRCLFQIKVLSSNSRRQICHPPFQIAFILGIRNPGEYDLDPRLGKNGVEQLGEFPGPVFLTTSPAIVTDGLLLGLARGTGRA
jgi:hypothetical protein